MAIRVRKLAKQLGKPPIELLGILKAIGFQRYKSPEDMLSGAVESKLRTAVKQGIRPAAVVPERVRKKPVVVESVEMDGLIPGVVRTFDERFESAPTAAVRATPRPSPAPPVVRPTPVVPAAREPVDPRLVDAERSVLVAERAAIEAERSALQSEKRALEVRLEALEAERTALQSVRDSSTTTPLAAVFADRGLVGSDEVERAFRALAGARRIAEMLPYLHVRDTVGLQSWLRDVLVLVDGPAPEALGSEAAVTVAAERAEFPGVAAWRRLGSRLSELLLLNGARRVLVVGGSARAHRLLRNGLDPRIEIRFRPGSRVVVSEAEADLMRTDAIALWEVDVEPEADERYGSGRALVARIAGGGVRTFVEEWIRYLERSEG